MFHGWRNYGTISRSASGEHSIPDVRSVSYAEDFLPQAKRRAALACILLCQLFSWIAFNAIMLPQMNIYTSGLDAKLENWADQMSETIYYTLMYSMALIAGVVMDAWIKKTYFLMTGVVLASVGIVSVTIGAIMYDNPMAQIPIFAIPLLEAFISISLSTLGGDQIPERTDVRSFYATFYSCKKAAKVISCGIYIYILTDYNRTHKRNVGWASMIISSSVLSIATGLMVACSKWTRQINADSSALTNPFRIWKEAFQRRRGRAEGDRFLSMAMISKGGSFADQLVEEISKVFKFFVVLACLIPVALSVKLPGIQTSCYYDFNASHASESATYIHFNSPADNLTNSTPRYPYPRPGSMLSPLVNALTSLVAIPIIHILCMWLAKKGYPPSLLHRLISGHIVMTTANLMYIIYIDSLFKDGAWCTTGILVALSALDGLCKAFIYTTGYEMTLIFAPRSMQGIAMGMFFFLDAVSSYIYLPLSNFGKTVPIGELNRKFSTAGVILPFFGMLLLIFAQKRHNLGLDLH